MAAAQLNKENLRKQFSRDWKKHYRVKVFREKGFERKVCKKCGKGFWTLDKARTTCADSSCQSYDFIGKPITRKKMDYTSTWKLFEKFFKKNGHQAIQRYPVIDRIRPDLFFTIASIQDFQRLDNGNMIFVYPANPLVVPQTCLRFSDIPSVGISGRHLTSFVMPGQHAFNHPKEGYFKDRCMELNFNFLTTQMGIPEKELVYMEDVWAMPDFSAFGPSIETVSMGLELVNHVFMQFQKSGSGFRELGMKVIDTGWGHERLVWFSNGTETMYDCIFGPMLDRLKKESGVRPEPKLFMKYSRLAGVLDIDEIKDPTQAREKIAKEIGVSVKELKEQIEPMQAMYAIADHTRTLLFAVTDGGIPSNVGGGYNLRVLLRRVFSFMKEHGFQFDVVGAAEQHAKFLKPMFPELRDGIEPMAKIIDVERQRYESTLKSASGIIAKMSKRGKRFDEATLVKLYESHGISPEMVKEVTNAEIPAGVYSKITQGHETREKEEENEKIDLSGLPDTKLLFYEDQSKRKFTAKVLKTIGDKVVLDKTAFYAESGGQESDHGYISAGKKRQRVYDVQKIGGVVLHYVEKQAFKQGDTLTGELDWERREQLSKHHTAIHLINAAARKVLGRHIWQAGSGKSTEKAHLDITHYLPITAQERGKIEEIANDMVKKSLPITASWLPREEAEKKYGFRLYQGGAVPGKEIRVVEVNSVDVEACGGLHRSNTNEVGDLIVISTERIQDGVDRITIKAGGAAKRHLEKSIAKANQLIEFIRRDLHFVRLSDTFISTLDSKTAIHQLEKSAEVFSVPVSGLENAAKRFCKEILKNHQDMNSILKRMGKPEKGLDDYLQLTRAESLEDVFKAVFNAWKRQKKELEKLRSGFAKAEARKILELHKVHKGQLFEVIGMERKDLIAIAEELLSLKPGITVILANQVGDVVGMTGDKKKDMNKIIKELCSEAGGSGGGRTDFAQGKAELSKLMKVAGKM